MHNVLYEIFLLSVLFLMRVFIRIKTRAREEYSFIYISYMCALLLAIEQAFFLQNLV